MVTKGINKYHAGSIRPLHIMVIIRTILRVTGSIRHGHRHQLFRNESTILDDLMVHRLIDFIFVKNDQHPRPRSSSAAETREYPKSCLQKFVFAAPQLPSTGPNLLGERLRFSSTSGGWWRVNRFRWRRWNARWRKIALHLIRLRALEQAHRTDQPRYPVSCCLPLGLLAPVAATDQLGAVAGSEGHRRASSLATVSPGHRTLGTMSVSIGLFSRLYEMYVDTRTLIRSKFPSNTKNLDATYLHGYFLNAPVKRPSAVFEINATVQARLRDAVDGECLTHFRRARFLDFLGWR